MRDMDYAGSIRTLLHIPEAPETAVLRTALEWIADYTFNAPPNSPFDKIWLTAQAALNFQPKPHGPPTPAHEKDRSVLPPSNSPGNPDRDQLVTPPSESE